ncbi:sensor histidine kinase [Nonomuraea sp. NEAU-A123]|uniref:sensor histidine kinase n=1 Tax=Nonomuraea sp. NEAU-A123 TaxID=2839649 RepID=UPI001BE4C355|nr:sensor histidine kinase [Nonomuraea sp. NEAU-A123]MBT2227099.1 sensor histidine kinase [Nonomuraea sp. NEAU-A123]
MTFRDPDRPVLLSVAFWVIFATVLAGGAGTAGSWPRFALFAGVMALVAALWLIMPWSPAASPVRKLAAPTLMVTVLLIGQVLSGWHIALVFVAIVNLAFVYGMRTAIVITAIYLLCVGGSIPLLFDASWLQALDQFVPMTLLAVFSLVMTSALLEAGRQRAAAQRLIERIRELAVAEERARMARDMHDSIGHQLTVIKVNLENAERYRERHPELIWEEVRQAKEMTVQALAEARRWVRALRPLALDGQVGSTALGRLARSFEGAGVEVSFTVDGIERRIDPDSELVLYRVLQEGFTNALRHAEARQVRARLDFGEDRVVLVIGDDGKGAVDAAGFGLSSLAERVRAIGGSFRAANARDGGFELRAEVPVARP